VTTEFLPIGLLPHIAADVGVTSGRAGLMVTLPAVVAAVSAPTTVALAGRIDRRLLLCALMGLLVVSNLVVASGYSLPVLLIGRLFVGIAVGGFWTVGGSLGPRLRPGAQGPVATSIIFSGVSLGTIAGLPAGALLGNLIGWRMTFMAASAVALAVIAALLIFLPSIRPQPGAGAGSIAVVIKRRQVRIGLIAAALTFAGHFVAYTYIAPFLDITAHVDGATLSAVLLAYGSAGFVGNLVGGRLAARHTAAAVFSGTVIIAVALIAAVLTGSHQLVAISAVALWGFGFGLFPIAIQTYLLAATPDHLESANALLVAFAQAFVGLGALVGGAIVDNTGIAGTFWLGAIMALMTAALISVFGRPERRNSLAS
jgi:predicted MFS family arabinose efflux permease